MEVWKIRLVREKRLSKVIIVHAVEKNVLFAMSLGLVWKLEELFIDC
jgi:hypothetical protein